MEINPSYTKALIQLGLSLRELGKSDEAVKVLSRALEASPDTVELHYQLGLIFADRHELAMAVERFEAALRLDPRNLDFRANLALALQNMGLIDRAAATWDALCDLARETPRGPRGRRASPRGRIRLAPQRERIAIPQRPHAWAGVGLQPAWDRQTTDFTGSDVNPVTPHPSSSPSPSSSSSSSTSYSFWHRSWHRS